MATIHCPQCGHPEIDPDDENRAFIRAFKVFDEHGSWSQCLVCSGYYSKSMTGKMIETPKKWNRDKGWFVD